AGILCSGTQPGVLVPSSARNALSRIGIRQCRVRACCFLLYPQPVAEQNVAPGQDQPAVFPPSTLRTWPVINEASSDAMKTIALASSSDRPRRPIGTPVIRAVFLSGVPVKRVNMPVSV